MLDLRLFLPKRVPLPLVAVIVLGAVGSWLPLAVILHYTQVYHERPRIHLFQDMDNQPKLKAQAASAVFNDGRAMRQPVAGTVSRGRLAAANGGPLQDGYVLKPGTQNHDHGDNHSTDQADGQADGQGDEAEESPVTFVTGFPEGLVVDEFFIARGQHQFNVSCTPCHGEAGMGNGAVNQRAIALQLGDATLGYGTAWAPAANLMTVEDGKLKFGEDLYPNGQIYNVIAHGKGTMAGHAHRITVEDRWAIVAYVRALQLSQNPTAAKAAANRAESHKTAAR